MACFGEICSPENLQKEANVPDNTLVPWNHSIHEKKRHRNVAFGRLLSNSQFIQQIEVPIGLDPSDIIQQSTPTRYQSEESSPGSKIFGVSLHVFGKIINPGG